jgi:hypothetical protein
MQIGIDALFMEVGLNSGIVVPLSRMSRGTCSPRALIIIHKTRFERNVHSAFLPPFFRMDRWRRSYYLPQDLAPEQIQDLSALTIYPERKVMEFKLQLAALAHSEMEKCFLHQQIFRREQF